MKTNNEINIASINEYRTHKCRTFYKYHRFISVKKSKIKINILLKCNEFQILHYNQYLFYNHHTIMINEYNNQNVIACMFSPYFILEFWCL